MEYFVTGGTGFIGTHLVTQLVSEGHDIIVLTRSRSNADHLPDAVTIVEGDITAKESMREAMVGVDRLFHLAAWVHIGPGRRCREKAERTNVDGTRNVLELMDELGIPKGVYTSTIGVYPPAENDVIDESRRPDPPNLAVYNRTKWQAYAEVARPMIDDGLPVDIVLPGNVYGPGDKPTSPARLLFRAYLQGRLPVVPRDCYGPWDHVADIANAHRLAMDRDDTGETYIIAGESRSLADVFGCAEELTGVQAPRPVPSWTFDVLSTVMAGVERVIRPPRGAEAESLRMFANSSWLVDNSKATEELGVEHRPLKDGLNEYLPWERNQLGLTELNEPNSL